MHRLPADLPENILYDNPYAAERKLEKNYKVEAKKPYPDPRPQVVNYVKGGY